MVDQKVIDYIRNAAAKGESREQIKSEFLATGWTNEAVEAILKQNFDNVKKADPAQHSGKFAYILVIIILIMLAAAGTFIFLNVFNENKAMQLEDELGVGDNMAVENQSAEPAAMNETVEENVTEEVVEEPEAPVHMSALPDPCVNITCNSVAVGTGGKPSAVWTGSGFGVVWSSYDGEKSTLYFAKLDSSGNVQGIVESAENNGEAGDPSLVFDGSSYEAVWPAENSLYFIRMDASGKRIGEALNLNTRPVVIGRASLVWNGNGFGVVWDDSSSKTYFAMLDANGAKIGNDTEVGLVSSEEPTVVWAKDEYGVSFVENKGGAKDIYLRRYDSDAKLLSTIKIINGYVYCDELSLSWADNSYGLIYGCIEDNRVTDRAKEDVYFMRVYSTGGAAEMVELDQGIFPLSNTPVYSGTPTISFTDGNFGTAWVDSSGGSRQVYFNRLDPRTGTKREEEIKITDSVADSESPALIRTDDDYALFWIEVSGEQKDVWMGRFE